MLIFWYPTGRPITKHHRKRRRRKQHDDRDSLLDSEALPIIGEKPERRHRQETIIVEGPHRQETILVEEEDPREHPSHYKGSSRYRENSARYRERDRDQDTVFSSEMRREKV